MLITFLSFNSIYDKMAHFCHSRVAFSQLWSHSVLSRLVRASGVLKDVFSHFIKLHSFLSVVTNMILADKNFGVVLMTLDCLQSTTYKKRYAFIWLSGLWLAFSCLLHKALFPLAQKKIQFKVFHLIDASMACMLQFLSLLCMTCFKWFSPNFLLQSNPVADG